MERFFTYLFAFLFSTCAYAAVAPMSGRVSGYVDPQSYAYMYPYLNNKMRTEMNPGTTVSMANNPIDVIVKTKAMSNQRRVVPRTSRAATTGAARTATTGATKSGRRVVPRTAKTTATAAKSPASKAARATTNTRNVISRAATRDNATTTATTTNIVTESVSSSRCMADYATCMNRYCIRENTAYNRCYCSAKLTQIDAQYQPVISDLITQIITLQGGGQWTQEEMNEYWMESIGKYTGENSWVSLDNALNIDWPEPEERNSGQNAFMVGHQYCIQHLRACAYMSSNLRDAYRSQISRDCTTYEKQMERIKTAAEAMIEYYSE